MFMDLVVTALRRAHYKSLITTETVSEESKIPIRIVGVAEPSAHEHKPTIYPVAIFACAISGNNTREFVRCFWGEHLVGIEDKHPLVAKRQVLQRPVFLFRPHSIKIKLVHNRTGFFSDGLRAIRTV